VKHLIWVPASIALLALAALALVRQVTGGPHTREVLTTAAIVIVSTELALLPITLARRAGPVAVFQAAFGGTVIHLFLALAMGAACHVLHLVSGGGLFLFLLLGLYWVSLIVLVVAMVRIFRASAAGGLHPGSPTSPTPQAT
jgi:hypothetical protein